MNKKKVIELIEKLICFTKARDVDYMHGKIKSHIINVLRNVLSELSKSDWISVEDELPPYEEAVLVTSKEDTEEIYFSHRTNRKDVIVDKHQFATYKGSKPITHWRRIDKLEA